MPNLSLCDRGYHDRPRGADCCIECGAGVTRAGRATVAARESAEADRAARNQDARELRTVTRLVAGDDEDVWAGL